MMDRLGGTLDLAASVSAEASFADRIAVFLERRAAWLFAAFSVVYFFATWHVVHIRPLWFDEIMTYYVARLPVPKLLAALHHAADFTPPLFDILEHPLALKDPVLIRVPAMLGIWCMSLSLYLLVSRVRSPIHGLLAALLPQLTAVGHYAAEGRSYGIILGASAAALLFWQRLGESPRHRAWYLLGMGLSVALAVSVHYFGFLVVGPLLLGEVVRWMDRRRVNLSVPATLVAAMLPMVAAIPFILAVRRPEIVHWGLADPASFRQTFVELMGTGIWWICLVFGAGAVAVVLWPALEDSPLVGRALPRDIKAALGGFVLLPFVAIVVGYVAHGYAPRYAIVATVGASAGLACLVPRRGITAAAVCALTGLLVSGMQIHLLTRPADPPPQPPAAAIASGLPIAYQSLHESIETQFYAPPNVAGQLHLLTDGPLWLAWSGQNSFHYYALAAASISNCQVDDLHTFLKANHRFLLLVDVDDARPWLVAQLTREGANLVVRAATATQTLYEVTPAS